jgi:hypothetical protein
LSGEGRRVKRAVEAERMSANPQQLNSKVPPQPKAPERDSIRRELDRVQRQLEGLSKVVKKIKEAT